MFILGDEILSVNSKPLHGMTHAQAIAEFKNVKAGNVVLHIGRRKRANANLTNSTSTPSAAQNKKQIKVLTTPTSVIVTRKTRHDSNNINNHESHQKLQAAWL